MAFLAVALCVGLSAPGASFALDVVSPYWPAFLTGQRPTPPPADFSGQAASDDARQVTGWVVKTGDNRGLPFVIVDKKATKVFVFDAHGALLRATDALLGLARGTIQRRVPGSESCRRSCHGSAPRLRRASWRRWATPWASRTCFGWTMTPPWPCTACWPPTAASERRLERLAATSPLDHQITYGCINVPAGFYDAVVHPAFAGTRGVVYILP